MSYMVFSQIPFKRGFRQQRDFASNLDAKLAMRGGTKKKRDKDPSFPVPCCPLQISKQFVLKKPSLPRGSHREYFFWLEEKICILAGGRTGERAGRPLVARKRIKEVDIAQELLRGACLSSLLFFSRKINPQKSEICSHKQVRGQKKTR